MGADFRHHVIPVHSPDESYNDLLLSLRERVLYFFRIDLAGNFFSVLLQDAAFWRSELFQHQAAILIFQKNMGSRV